VAGSCEYGDEPSGYGTMELVGYFYECLLLPPQQLQCHYYGIVQNYRSLIFEVDTTQAVDVVLVDCDALWT
jgi:hypothetical protein